MDDYQSSFSGEEIDDILAKAKRGGLTVQSEIEIITCNLDVATLTISNMSHTFQQILEAIKENKNVIGRAEVQGASVFCTLAFVQNEQIIAFNLLTYMNIGLGTDLYYFRIIVNQNNNTSVTPLVISTVS